MSEWVTKPLGEMVTFQKGRKVKTSPYPLDGYREYLGAGKLSNSFDGYASTFSAVLAKESDILMLWDGERSGLCRTELSGVVSSTVSKLTPTDSIDSSFLYYLLLQCYGWIQHRRTGTGVPHVPKDLGRILHLSYPRNMDEQKKIARILQAIDRAIEKTEALIDKYQKIKAGLMQDLFTRGVDSDGRMRPPREQAPKLYQKTQIGWVPREWALSPIGSYVLSAEYGISTSLESESVGIPVLRMNNIKANSFDVSDLKYSSDKEAYRLSLRPRDVLYNRTNSFEHVGKTAIWKGELTSCSFASYLVRINLDLDRILPEFFAHWMSQESSQNALRRFATPGVQQVNINPTNLQRVEIGVPGIVEQASIVTRLDAIDNEIEVEHQYLGKLAKQKSGLIHDLLTGKVAVQVKPDAEPEAAYV